LVKLFVPQAQIGPLRVLSGFSKRTAAALALVLSALNVFAQSQDIMIQPRRLIDAHTAGILPKGNYDFECRIYPAGEDDVWGCGIQMAIGVGITKRLNIGISYGGDGLVGRGSTVRGNPYPGGLIKYRILEENMHFPALALGYEHQGYGGIERTEYDGYVNKSQGFFLALSKNYLLLKTVQFGVHGAANYSFEQHRQVTWPSGYLGLDIGLNNELALAFEYDLALNARDPADWDTLVEVSSHDSKMYINPLQGHLNAGLRWAFSPQFYLEFNVKDVLENRVRQNPQGGSKPLGWSRELKLVYLNNF
jgi:hypothetical protein